MAFLAFTALQFAFRRSVGAVLNVYLNVRPARFLINLFTPQDTVRAQGDRLVSAVASIQVAKGCEGLDVMLLFIAGMLVMPMPRRRKVFGTLLGLAVLYGANLLRVVGLWYCLRHAPQLFETMHVIVGQTAIIVVAVVLFVGMSGLLRRAPAVPA